MIIRKYKKGDEIGILKLDKMVEEHPWNRRNLKNWEWKYKGKNPFGKSIVFVATNNQKILATFSIIPLKYKIMGRIVNGSCSIAMIVHPKYQNKGLIKFVADKLFEEASKRNIEFIYGYPNSNAYEIHKKIFNYEDINMQSLYLKKINYNIKLAKENFKIVKKKKFEKKINRLFENANSQYKVSLKRDYKYLNWRYSDRPDKKYHLFVFYKDNEIVGYSILKLYKEKNILRGHMIDLFYNIKFKGLFKCIILHSYKFFKNKKCTEMTLWLQGDQKAQLELKNLKFKIHSKRPFICKNLSLSKKLKLLLNKKNWYFTMGDTLEIY